MCVLGGGVGRREYEILEQEFFQIFFFPPFIFLFFCAPCKPLTPPPAPYLNEVANKSLMPRAKS